MCGIAGVWHQDGQPVDERTLARMAGCLLHRGPDDGRTFADNDGLPSVGLASRRLAIVDIPGGAQPMSTEDGRHTIAYNGELFNAAELRLLLEQKGHSFRSRCDTEVVLRAIAEWGPNAFARLDGMWAVAAWDSTKRQLLLARDHLGVKPLVYAACPNRVVFASEIKAVFASELVERRLDPQGLSFYLSSFAVPEPHTFFDGVRRLAAGHYLVANAEGIREVQYWDCAIEEEADKGLGAYVDEVGELLEDSVRRQLVSDVPLGVFLSSGIDSSLIAALAAKHVGRHLHTFTIGFDGSGQDELAGARRLADALGADHAEERVTARDAASVLPSLLAAHDEPAQSLLQGHFASRLAKRTVTVALSGLGGDELFSSYPTHRVVSLLAQIDRVPEPLRGVAMAVAGAIGGGRGKRLAALARLPGDSRVSTWLLHQTPKDLRRVLLSPDVAAAIDLDAPENAIAYHYGKARARDPLNRLLYVYVKTYLADELLRTLDSMSMFHSLEARVPLLDRRIVELAMRMPAHHKMLLGRGKRVLRRLAPRILPKDLVPRAKRGFSLPLSIWLRGELLEMVRDVLCETAIRQRALFDPTAVARVVDGYAQGSESLVQPVMMLLSFELWARETAKPSSPTPVIEVRPATVDAPALSVIIVNWNTREILRSNLSSIERYLAEIPHEVIVVDNASSDGSAEMVASEFPRVGLITNRDNVGFGRANNQAMRVARGNWYLLLNSDTCMTDTSIAELLPRLTAGPAGVAHCRLTLSDGRVQHSTYKFPSLRLAVLEDLGLYRLLSTRARGQLLLNGYWDHEAERDVDWVSGAFMLFPREVFQKTGGFSEAFFMYGEDMEWCHRIRAAGYPIRYYPNASVVHLDHSSSDLRWGSERIAICIRRELEIYRNWTGPGRAMLFHGVRTMGSLLRLLYFGCRSVVGGSRAPYFRTMKEHSRFALQARVGLLTRRS